MTSGKRLHFLLILGTSQEEDIRLFLSNSLSEAEEAVKNSPNDLPKQAHYFTIKGVMSGWCFGKEHRKEDLTDSIAAFRKASQLTPDDDPTKLHCLNNITRSLVTLFHETGDRNVLEEAVHMANIAVAKYIFTGHNDDRIDAIHLLGSSLQLKFDRYGQSRELERALEMLTIIVEHTSIEDPDRSGRLSDLVNALESHF